MSFEALIVGFGLGVLVMMFLIHIAVPGMKRTWTERYAARRRIVLKHRGKVISEISLADYDHIHQVHTGRPAPDAIVIDALPASYIETPWNR